MTSTHSASLTARERARAELTREIKEEARRQLAASGAQGLSLRSVARELGMVSSALYRYFRSRDELLTALIIDAYDALGAAAEAASAGLPAADIRGRWRATCATIRTWAVANPHEYALIYGSPVPGYQAPQATVAPAGRVVRVMGGILSDAAAATRHAKERRPKERRPEEGRPEEGRPEEERQRERRPEEGRPEEERQRERRPEEGRPEEQPLPPELAGQAAIVADAVAPGAGHAVIARALIAWTQVFGMISFELFGQFAGSLEPADAFFGYAVEQMADYIGLP